MSDRFWVWAMIAVAVASGAVVTYNATHDRPCLAVFGAAWLSVFSQLARHAQGRPPDPAERTKRCRSPGP